MSSENSKESFEFELRLDPKMEPPKFFSYVRGVIAKKVTNFEDRVQSDVSDISTRLVLLRDAQSAWKAFEVRVSEAENVAGSKKQSRELTAAILEFNAAMKELDSRLKEEIRLQESRGGISEPALPEEDDFRLRSDEAIRFLRENDW